jgi:hypothetical protein
MNAERGGGVVVDPRTKSSLLFLHNFLLFLESRDATLQALVHRRRVDWKVRLLF